MTARAASLRDTVIAAIDTARTSLCVAGFIMTKPGDTHTGDASNFHVPLGGLVDLTVPGRVWVVSLVGDQNQPQTRNYSCIETIPIQVCYHCKIADLKSDTFFDLRIELCEQLKNVVRKAAPSWATWVRTEAERDENGTPYAYRVLREDSVFMCVFTAYFETYLESGE